MAGGAQAQQRQVTGTKVMIITDDASAGTSQPWQSIQFLADALTAVNKSYDVFTVNASSRPDSTWFWNADGTGKYVGYIMYPPLESRGALTPSEISLIWDYAAKTAVRSIKYGCGMTTLGFTETSAPGGPLNTQLSWKPDAPFGTSGVSPNASFSDGGVWLKPGVEAQPLTSCDIWYSPTSTLISSPCTPTAILMASTVPASVVGALDVNSDGREVMGFNYDCGVGPQCSTTAQLAVNWMLVPRPFVPIPSPSPSPPPQPRPATLYLQHKTLVLTTPGFTNIDFLEAIFKGYGSPYDIVRWDVGSVSPPKPDLNALLYNADGSARYSSIFMHPNLEAMSLMNITEINILWQFQIRFGVRTVKVGAGNPELGYDYSGTCGGGAEAMLFTADAPPGISGVNVAAAQPNYNGIWRCPGKPTANGCPLQSVVGANPYNPNASATLPVNCTPTPMIKNAAGYTLATLIKYQDGRESMGFMHECAAWSSTCLLLGHMALSWANQGFTAGERANLISIQTDDFFLSTDQDDTGTQYRVSPYDLQRHLQWLSDLKSGAVTGITLAPNSDLRIDLPFNGNGILENSTKLTEITVDGESCTTFPEYVNLSCNCWATGYQACPTTEDVFCRHCTKDWPKPLGTGTNKVTSLPNTGLWTPTNLNPDPLAAAVLANTGGITTGFHWCHHTFTHENLDNVTKYDADKQLSLNIRMAANLSLSGRDVFSHSCMVTPEISGLMNGDVLTALGNNGITCSTGDNTWRHLLNQNNPHQMLYTTLASSNFAGYAILPRWATEIYYNCSLQSQNLALYNGIYSSQLGISTFDQLLSREADRVSYNILALRKDPHMMHQANLRVEGGSRTDFTVGSSLLMKWMEAVLIRVTNLVTWPVRSLKLDDLMAAFKAREARDACQPSYRLEVDSATGAVQAVTVKSNGGACSAPFTVGSTVAVGLPASAKDGTDVTAPIYRVDLAAGASTRVVLSNAQTWVLPPLS